MGKNSARTKRVMEIEKLKSQLPDTDFIIWIITPTSGIQLSTYKDAVSVLSSMFPEHGFNTREDINFKYVFSVIATSKELAKKCKISISSIIHQNYKNK